MASFCIQQEADFDSGDCQLYRFVLKAWALGFSGCSALGGFFYARRALRFDTFLMVN
jgi:hypothetical protein